MTTQPAILVLAAGRGQRFRGSSHKLAQPFYGSTVLGSTLKSVLATGLPFAVVVRPDLAELARGHVASRDVVILPDSAEPSMGSGGVSSEWVAPQAWAEGMGSSIASGVQARSGAGGWLIWPADMPLIRPETAVAVAAGLASQPVAYAQHKGRRGHPVAFSAELYSELIRLRGDEGARRLLARYPSLAVEVADPGVLFDIDTPEDLAEGAGLPLPQV